jgi:hypothetical protein
MSAGQLDLFAANQLDLLATPAPAAASVVRNSGLGGMPRSVQAKWDRAWTVDVRQAFLDVAIAQPGEWIDSSRFYRAVAIPQDIGCCWGHAMHAMVAAGMLEERPRYFGSDHPGKPNYQGHTNEYRWHPPMSGEARA